MPVSMPVGVNITVQRRELAPDYRMPQMEMAEEHYSMGYVISGDRRMITPKQHFDYHPGDVTLMPPLLYHRTISQSDAPYVSYLIKISGECRDEFCRSVDRSIWESLFEQKFFSFDPEHRDRMENMFADMLAEYESPAPYAPVILQGMLFRMLTYIWENHRGERAMEFGRELSEGIMEALSHIEEYYDRELTLEQMASDAGFSTAYFSRLFKSQLGVTFSECLTNVRIRHAKELLIQTDRPIAQIAIETGFCNGDYLAMRFRQKEGMTPTAFRNQRK
ncbi:MAG: AraC family transcriptional regulator [Lachnospiraceae bacterium]|nr:AraC family transcriptional regulator [Lachnospiraceae bacterium]